MGNVVLNVDLPDTSPDTFDGYTTEKRWGGGCSDLHGAWLNGGRSWREVGEEVCFFD